MQPPQLSLEPMNFRQQALLLWQERFCYFTQPEAFFRETFAKVRFGTVVRVMLSLLFINIFIGSLTYIVHAGGLQNVAEYTYQVPPLSPRSPLLSLFGNLVFVLIILPPMIFYTTVFTNWIKQTSRTWCDIAKGLIHSNNIGLAIYLLVPLSPAPSEYITIVALPLSLTSSYILAKYYLDLSAMEILGFLLGWVVFALCLIGMGCLFYNGL